MDVPGFTKLRRPRSREECDANPTDDGFESVERAKDSGAPSAIIIRTRSSISIWHRRRKKDSLLDWHTLLVAFSNIIRTTIQYHHVCCQICRYKSPPDFQVARDQVVVACTSRSSDDVNVQREQGRVQKGGRYILYTIKANSIKCTMRLCYQET